jgi:hypothetical protein
MNRHVEAAIPSGAPSVCQRWQVGQRRFHLPRKPLTCIAKNKTRKDPAGLPRWDRQTANLCGFHYSPPVCLAVVVAQRREGIVTIGRGVVAIAWRLPRGTGLTIAV